jgi:hypothetical protein
MGCVLALTTTSHFNKAAPVSHWAREQVALVCSFISSLHSNYSAGKCMQHILLSGSQHWNAAVCSWSKDQ